MANDRITIRRLPANAPWECYVCPMPRYPVPKQDRALWVRFLDRLTAELRSRNPLDLSLLLQVLQLHLDGGSNLVSERGAEWLPELGLGVWPDRPPPTSWSAKNFFSVPPGYDQPVLMYQLLRVTTTEEARLAARDLLLGRGIVLQILSPLSDSELMEAGRKVLLPPIQEAAFRAFPFHLPMVSASTFANASAGRLDEWMCGASVYIRESVEDSGLLIASREPLAPPLEALGGRHDGESGNWEVPARDPGSQE